MYRQIVNSGEVVGWDVVVSNGGDDTAKSVIGELFITDDLLPYIEVVNSRKPVSPEVTKGFYNHADKKWVVGDLESGESQSIKFNIKINDINIFENYEEINIYFKFVCDCGETSLVDNDVILTLSKVSSCDRINLKIGPY